MENKTRKIRKNSWNEKLSKLELNERFYIETTAENAAQQERTVYNPSRLPKTMSDRKFRTNIFIACPTGLKFTDIRYIICVERIM